MVLAILGNFAFGCLMIFVALLFLMQLVRYGFVNTGRLGVFVPALGLQAQVIVSLPFLMGTFCISYAVYLLACLCVYQGRGDFAFSTEPVINIRCIESASTLSVFLAILVESLGVTILMLSFLPRLLK